MDALQALLSRVSPARLAPEEPDPLMIEQILAAGLRAADHGRLRPWRFLVVRGEARHRLGELLADGLKLRNPEAGAEMLEAERNKALRAPVHRTCSSRRTPSASEGSGAPARPPTIPCSRRRWAPRRRTSSSAFSIL